MTHNLHFVATLLFAIGLASIGLVMLIALGDAPVEDASRYHWFAIIFIVIGLIVAALAPFGRR